MLAFITDQMCRILARTSDSLRKALSFSRMSFQMGSALLSACSSNSAPFENGCGTGKEFVVARFGLAFLQNEATADGVIHVCRNGHLLLVESGEAHPIRMAWQN